MKTTQEKSKEISKSYINWDEYFMSIATISSMRSKDPRTKVGACIVSEDKRILSIGYNGMPNGCDDEEFPWCGDENGGAFHETKYAYVTHAELNAILNAANHGVKLKGSIVYVTLFPCNECAKAIIQCGIKSIIYDSDKYNGTPSNTISKKLLDAAGVTYRKYESTGRTVTMEL